MSCVTRSTMQTSPGVSTPLQSFQRGGSAERVYFLVLTLGQLIKLIKTSLFSEGSTTRPITARASHYSASHFSFQHVSLQCYNVKVHKDLHVLLDHASSLDCTFNLQKILNEQSPIYLACLLNSYKLVSFRSSLLYCIIISIYFREPNRNFCCLIIFCNL